MQSGRNLAGAVNLAAAKTRITGDLLRRLSENLVPISEMRTEEEISSWWKHYAGHVRNALKDVNVEVDSAKDGSFVTSHQVGHHRG